MSVRFLSPADCDALEAAARPLVAEATGRCRFLDPDFDGWDPDKQAAAVLIVAVQALLRPGAHAATELDLNAAGYGIGVGLGNSFAAAGGHDFDHFLTEIARGIGQGNAQTAQAAAVMPTIGGKQ